MDDFYIEMIKQWGPLGVLGVAFLLLLRAYISQGEKYIEALEKAASAMDASQAKYADLVAKSVAAWEGTRVMIDERLHHGGRR